MTGLLGECMNPPDLRDLILAHMHLHAVLPRIVDLIRIDDESTRVAQEMDVSIAFAVRGGPYLVLKVSRGVAGVSTSGLADVVLFFPSCRRLNRMFQGEKVNPIPLWGLHRFRDLKRFSSLSDRLTRHLKPSEQDLSDEAFRRRHVELSLLVGLAACGVIAKLDPRVQRVVKGLHAGIIQYSVLPNGPHAYVEVQHGTVSAFAGRVPAPSATIELKDLKFAVKLIRGEVDPFAASGLGDIRLSGDLHLVDLFNNLFDRVGLYLK